MTLTIDQLIEKTIDAYSFENYGYKSWKASIKMLRGRGFNDIEIHAIMISKHTRWAHDVSGKRFGQTTSKDLERYITGKHASHFTSENVTKLVLGTFGQTSYQ